MYMYMYMYMYSIVPESDGEGGGLAQSAQVEVVLQHRDKRGNAFRRPRLTV